MMTSPSTSDEAFRVARLHKNAVDCLETFPKKIDGLNKLIKDYGPKVERRKNGKIRKRRREPRISIIKAPKRAPRVTAKSNCSLAVCDRDRTIRKRRYYRLQGVRDCDRRRRPGPLGYLLSFIIKQLVFCTKNFLIEPYRLFAGNVMSTLYQRPNPTNLESISCTNWVGSMPVLKSDDKITGKLVEIMRPIAIELITDTTTLKRWLQALVAGDRESPPHELANASRITETVDYWAYDLFFQLKYLQMNALPENHGETREDKRKPKGIPSSSILWRRLRELREKYTILYETLEKLDNTRIPPNGKKFEEGR